MYVRKKTHPNSIFKDKASLHIYIIVGMVQKKKKNSNCGIYIFCSE